MTTSYSKVVRLIPAGALDPELLRALAGEIDGRIAEDASHMRRRDQNFRADPLTTDANGDAIFLRDVAAELERCGVEYVVKWRPEGIERPHVSLELAAEQLETVALILGKWGVGVLSDCDA